MRTRIAGGLSVSHLRSETDLKSQKIKENAPQVVACGVIFCVANECNF